MAITIRKVAPAPSPSSALSTPYLSLGIPKVQLSALSTTPPTKPVPTREEKEALVSLGLSAPTPHKTHIQAGDEWQQPKDGFPSYATGDRVVITNDLYRWVDLWKPGDMGTVVRFVPSPLEARQRGNRWALVVLKLDKCRVSGREEVCLHGWEVSPIINEVK